MGIMWYVRGGLGAAMPPGYPVSTDIWFSGFLAIRKRGQKTRINSQLSIKPGINSRIFNK
jgi:hypothetical protein